MSENAGSGTSENGGQGNETVEQNGAGTATGTKAAAAQAEDWGADDWKSLAKEVGLSPAEVRKRLEHSRTWEQRAKDNKAGAEQAKTLQQQVEAMQQQLSDREVRDVERAGRVALSQVKSTLAEAGIRAGDVKELLDEIDPTRLLKDGEPDEVAIERIVNALRRAAGRPSPDPDQGKRGAGASNDMNALIRRAAGVR